VREREDSRVPGGRARRWGIWDLRKGTAAQRPNGHVWKGERQLGVFITAGSEGVWLKRVGNEYAFLVERLLIFSFPFAFPAVV